VVGFQELQRDQLLTLRELTDLELYPGSELRTGAGQNSVAWDPRVWTAVEKRVVEVPYFRGRPTPMPYVRLRSVATGAEAWVVNVHNPASIRRHPRQQRFRDRATSIEIRLVNRLVEDTRLPVLLVGDMNAKDDYFCRLTASAPVTAARGGSNEGGVCRPDDPQAVDWIFGTRDVRFSDYREDRSPLVYRTTDHAVVVARAEIPVSR
jgi:hypothetical protein